MVLDFLSSAEVRSLLWPDGGAEQSKLWEAEADFLSLHGDSHFTSAFRAGRCDLWEWNVEYLLFQVVRKLFTSFLHKPWGTPNLLNWATEVFLPSIGQTPKTVDLASPTMQLCPTPLELLCQTWQNATQATENLGCFYRPSCPPHDL